MDSTDVPLSWQETDNIYNTCFIRHCPNQSEHHATLLNIILNTQTNYAKVAMEETVVEQHSETIHLQNAARFSILLHCL
jgi:hypothetical protein